MTFKPSKKTIIAGAAVLGGLLALECGGNPFFTVDPTDVAYVRHFDGAINPTPYINNGVHLKWPFLDTVDRLQISQKQIVMQQIPVVLKNDPDVKLDVTVNVQVPVQNAYHLLYGLGRPGNVDINSNVEPVVQSTIYGDLASSDFTALTTNYNQTRLNVLIDLTKQLHDQFGINVIKFNMYNIDPGDAYRDSSRKAVDAANHKLQAQFDADAQVIQATGQADVQIAQARGAAQSLIVAAEANKTAAQDNADAARIEGEGERDRLKEIISAFDGPAAATNAYISNLWAKGWHGSFPQVMAGGGAGQGTGAGAAPIVVVPQLPLSAPAAAAAAAAAPTAP